MLPKRYRLELRSRPNFFQEAKKFYSDFFTIYYQKSDWQQKDSKPGFDQAAVIVRKKDFKKAVARNQIRRKARAALTPLLDKKGLKIVVVLNKLVAKVSVKELQEELLNFFNKS